MTEAGSRSPDDRDEAAPEPAGVAQPAAVPEPAADELPATDEEPATDEKAATDEPAEAPDPGTAADPEAPAGPVYSPNDELAAAADLEPVPGDVLDADAPAALEAPEAPEAPDPAPATRRAPRGRSRATAAAEAGSSPDRRKAPRPRRASSGAPAEPADRPTGLRLARVHLRLGSLALARAELEALAGRGGLDEDALLDLAEVRWRTGDLAGAGEAAHALLGRGREDGLALVIAAEAIAAQGRPGEARRLSGRALAILGGPLDPLFAGMPRSSIWPDDVVAAADVPSASPARPRRATGTPVEAPGPASPAAAEAFAGGRAALGSNDVATAALRLGVALRLEPAFAPAVLDAIGDRSTEPALALVAGDALRLLGRESEALAAFDRARGRPVPVADQLELSVSAASGTPPDADA